MGLTVIWVQDSRRPEPAAQTGLQMLVEHSEFPVATAQPPMHTATLYRWNEWIPEVQQPEGSPWT